MGLTLASVAATVAANAGTIGTIASLAGAGISALGSIQQGKAAAASANYNAQMAANNAAIQRQNSSFAAQEGTANTEAASMKARAEYGAIKANQGASGVDVGSGSSVDVRSSARELGQLNALTVRSNAARQAYGYQTAAMNDEAQSGLDKSQAANASTAGYIGAGSTLLGGIGSTASNYATFKNKGGL